jgi:glycosyltransferase involved in cell wall biosynthesis
VAVKVVLASFDRLDAGKGAGAHILANAAILREAHDVSLVTLGEEPLPGWRHRPIHVPEANWLKRALMFRERVARVFAKEDFDVYHVRSPWEGLAAPPDRRILYEVNGLASIEAQYHFPAVLTRPDVRQKLRTLELCMLDRARTVLTPTRVTARYLADLGVEPARIAVVPNAPSVAEQPVERAPSDAVRLVYIGTLAPWQGLAELVSVLPRLTVPSRLTVLTRAADWRGRDLQKLARKRGVEVDVRPPLPPSLLGPFLATQDVGLAPLVPCERNLVQGCMPIKLLDYAAAGLPVLAPDMPVVREVLGDGYPLYPRWGRTSMVAHLQALADSPSMRRELGEAGQARVRGAAEAQRAALLAAYA